MDLTVLGFFGAWFTSLGGIWVLFNAPETAMKPVTRNALGQWLNNQLEKERGWYWPQFFTGLFDTVFTEKQWSWRCFRRSMVASFFAVLLMAMISLLMGHDYSLFGHSEFYTPIIFGVLINGVGDYFSLLETRYILGKMLNKGFKVRCLFILLDAIMTTIIFFIFLCVSGISIFVMAGLSPNNYFRELIVLIGEFSRIIIKFWAVEPQGGYGIFFYSTFFTSLWLYIFLIGSMCIKLISFVSERLRVTLGWFDVENKPLSTLGVMVMLLVSVMFLAVPIVRLFY